MSDSTNPSKLDQSNHERWFRQTGIQLRGKGWYYTIERTLDEYATVAGPTTATDDATAPRRCYNIELKSEYLKDEANALSYICTTLNDDDEALIDEYPTAYALWAYLKSKYTRVSAVTANTYMTMIQNFRFQPDTHLEMTIIQAWDKLKEYRRKLGAADESYRSAYQDTALFLVLARSLPADYQGVIDVLDIQTNLSIDDKIKHLQAKELRLADNPEQAQIASRSRYTPENRKSDIEAPNKICYLCKKEGHYILNCSHLERASKLLCSYLRHHKRKRSTKPRKVHFNKRDDAYPVDDDSESDSDTEDMIEEDCNLTKETIRQ